MNKKLLFLFCSLFLWIGAKAETVPLTSAKFGSNAATTTGQTVYATNHTADDALAISAYGFNRVLNATMMQGDGTTLTDGVPTAGHYFKLVPKFDGTIEVAFSIHADGKHITAAGQDGTVLAESDVPAKDQAASFLFDVEAGKTYYVYGIESNQVQYKSLTYKIDITDFRVRAGNEATWASGGRNNADVVIHHSGGTATELPHYNYSTGAYAQGANNLFITWQLDRTDVVQIRNDYQDFTGSHYYVRYWYVKPGEVRATLVFPGNEDYNPKTAMCVFSLEKIKQELAYVKATDEYNYAYNLRINQVTLNRNNVVNTVSFKSSDTNVATVNDNGVVSWTGNSGNAVITASAPGNDYYEAATASYTLVVKGTSEGPYLVWATQLNFNELTGEPVGSLTGGKYRGSYYGQYYYAKREKQMPDGSYQEVTGKDAIFAGYGNEQLFSAFAFKSQADIPDCFIPIPGQERVYWIKDKGWRTTSGGGSAALFWNNDASNSAIVYSVDKPEMIRSSRVDNESGSSRYHITPDYPSEDSLEVYAEIPGQGSRNPAKISTRYLVNPGYFNFSINPKEGVVNETCWIIPYVKIPDSRLDDFEYVYATVDNDAAVYVENGDAIYTGNVNDIGSYIEWKWSEPDAGGNQYKIITGIFPKIYGIQAGQEANVTIHIRSKIYYDTEATYHVKVIALEDDLFHWEMNDVAGKDDGEMKTITMFQGDFIHMPGIVGNPNGNDEFSKAESYKYLYSIEQGKVVLNKDAYFYREGIANYFFTNSPTNHSTPLIPQNGATTNQTALIFKAIGLGNYYRNDTVIIYGNKPGETYLWAEDAQTGYVCTPIKVVVKPRQDLLNQKTEIMSSMTYPYTWDFEHIDMTDIKRDATNGGDGNGGSYWRKRWDKDSHGVQHEKQYYQWNAPFNADYDDKDNNKVGSSGMGLRQRWFKDVAANGQYMHLFNGLMFNIAGLEYWQQKYTRLNVHEDGSFIYLEGGPHYIAMPGFGLVGTATVADATRSKGSVSMPGLHNQINTIDFNCAEADFATTNSGSAYSNVVPAGRENHNVKLVICAEGQRSDNGSVIYVGGKDMISTEMGVNHINTSHIYKTIHLEYETRRSYVIDLDPYDPIFQDQIYLCCDNDVKIFWMGISSEPRDMRNDYEVFTYSYPKDMDMDKTNQLMEQWANTGDETGVSTDEGYTPANGMGIEDVGFKAYYASDYTSDEDKLTLTEIPNYKFAAAEGVLVYPTKKVEEFGDLSALSGIVSKTVKNKKVTQVVMENGEPKKDPSTGHYVYEDKTYDYTYYYLPTYFIANAQNMNDYDSNPEGTDGVKRGKEPSLNEGASRVQETDGMPHNALTNKLDQSVWSTQIALDYEADGYKWVSLGLTNEYIGRYLTIDDDEDVHKVMTGYLENADGTQYEETSYYDLIGPDVVRFYRANKAGTMKGRRSYLNLTWKEYNVDTYGKSGVSNGEVTAKAVRIVFDGAEEDAVREVNGVAEQTNYDDAWYNLNGMKVKSLTKGIYIHNGKKIVVK